MKSPEGVAEYKKIGQSYPTEIMDDLYETDFLKDTSADPKLLAQYSKHVPIEVVAIFRKKTGEGKEFIYYSKTERRLDRALNPRHWFFSGIGKYPIPQGRYEIVHKDYGKTERVLREIMSVDTGYSIPFTPKNLDKIRDLGTPVGGKIAYYLETPNGITTSVDNYDSLRNCDFEALVHFGKTPTALQRRIWQDAQGIELDQKQLDDIKNRRESGDAPEVPVTVDQVRKIIKESKDKDREKQA
jgi:hypothetical protein